MSAALAHLDQDALTIARGLVDEKPAQALTLVEGGVEIYLPLEGVIDLDAERERIAVEMEELTQRIAEVEIRLRNENFITRRPSTSCSASETSATNAGALGEAARPAGAVGLSIVRSLCARFLIAGRCRERSPYVNGDVFWFDR